MRLERRADAHAARVIGAEPMLRALERIADLNMIKRRTGLWWWNLLTQHPWVAQRIEHLHGLERESDEESATGA